MGTLTLEEFYRKAADITQSARPADVPARIADALPGLLANGELLAPAHLVAPDGGYGRNIVFVCPNAAYSVLAVVWPPGIATPIHDHKTWCAFGVYQGGINEIRYDPADDGPGSHYALVRSVNDLAAGAVGHLPLSGNIHRIENRNGGDAISIHVYGGDCRTLGANVERIYKA